MITDWVWKQLLRLTRWIGYRTILLFLLLIFAMLFFWLGVQSAVSELRVTSGWLLILIATCMGWLVARLIRSTWFGLLILIGLGFIAVMFFSGGIFTPVRDVILSFKNIWIEQTDLLTWKLHVDALKVSLTELGQAAAILFNRLGNWLLAVFGEGSTDPVALQMFWGSLMWGAAAWTGWVLFRWDRPLLALFPAGALLGALIAYTGKPTFFVLLYLGVYLLLQALQGYVSRERHWEENRIDYPEIRFEFSIVAVGITIVLVTAAMIIPSISIQEIARKVNQLVDHAGTESIVESIGLKSQSKPESAFQPIIRGGLAREHLIGSGPELSQNVVMHVTIGGIGSFQRESDKQVINSLQSDTFLSRAPLYWRALTYDRYSGLGWFTSEIQEQKQAAGASLSLEIVSQGLGSFIMRQYVEKNAPADAYLYHTGNLLGIDQAVDIAYRSGGDQFAAQVKELSYTADSQLMVVSDEILRQAGSNYPDWVVERYLQLPENISKRVRNLAIDLTAREPTPYDRAYAIEQYLRTYPYTLDIPAPPKSVEIADYFLFDLRRGYCDYYSTSMIVLARAAGLPARYAVGYATGTWDSERRYFTVSEAEAHSWVEIYFPSIGWIPFEPTAGRQGITRPELLNVDELGSKIGELTPLVPYPVGYDGISVLKFAVVGFLLVVLTAVIIFITASRIRRQRLQPAQVIGESYQRMKEHASQMGMPITPGSTPIEISKAFSEEVSRFVQDNQTRAYIRRTIIWIGDVYSRGQYSVHSVTETEKERAIKSWGWFNQRIWSVRVRVKWLRYKWRNSAVKKDE